MAFCRFSVVLSEETVVDSQGYRDQISQGQGIPLVIETGFEPRLMQT